MKINAFRCLPSGLVASNAFLSWCVHNRPRSAGSESADNCSLRNVDSHIHGKQSEIAAKDIIYFDALE